MAPVQADVSPLQSLYQPHAGNAKFFPAVWVREAADVVQQLDRLAVLFPGGKQLKQPEHRLNLPESMAFNPVDTNSYRRLDKLFIDFGSDKGTTSMVTAWSGHNYTYTYMQILEALHWKARPLRLLEIGLGTNDTKAVSSMGGKGRPGASLRSWVEFLGDGHDVNGADFDRNILFTTERIRTTWVDQMDPNAFMPMHRALGNAPFDLLIDDGMHAVGTSFNTLLYGLEYGVKPGGFIVVEDIHSRMRPAFRLFDTMLRATGGATNIQTAFVVPRPREPHILMYVVRILGRG